MDGNVFFLHLPSTDGYGSVFKPPSAEYRANINAVDAGVSRTVYCTVLYCTVQVRRTVRVLDRFFRGDGGTAFLLTADHGMTDWGAHGTGADM